MILLLDFGNTRVKAAVIENGTLRQIYCGPVVMEHLLSVVEGLEIDGGLWCSVHELDVRFQDWMYGLGMKPLAVSTPVPLSVAYSTPETLGMDRLAAAVGAYSIKPGHDILVIDAGTAITYDFISADGVYKGGNIAPGMSMRFKALHDYTGALPLVASNGDLPMLGSDTATAIRSGVLNGIRHEIDGYINELRGIYPSLLVFLTGGDAEFFDIKGKCATFVVPNLVLEGLAQIVDYNGIQDL